MRVLFVNPVGDLGGSERSLLDVLASFQRSGLPVKTGLLVLSPGELARRAQELGVEVEVLPLPERLATLGESEGAGGDVVGRAGRLFAGAVAALPYLARFRRAVRTFAPDVLHTNGMKAHLLGALATPPLPRVVHLRDFASERPLSRRALGLLRRRALFVTNSRAVEQDALGVSSALKTRVVYNGIDLEEFRPAPRDPVTLARLAGLELPPPDAVTIGLVATYASWKGHRTFVAAARRVREAAGRPTRLYLVGGPIYRTQGSQVSEAELRSAIQHAGLERDAGLVPFQNDAAGVYHGLDVVVHASERREPFGRTIVEAMACQRAVVVARAGGALELFEEGRTALGFRPGDSADLARAILQLVHDEGLRARLAAAAHSEAAVRFDRNRLAGELFAAYRELLKSE